MAKVILVDDEATMVQMVAEMLRTEGHEVHPFTQVSPALEAIPDLLPDLVVTDLYIDKTRAGGLEDPRKSSISESADHRHHGDGIRIDRNGGKGDERRRLRLH